MVRSAALSGRGCRLKPAFQAVWVVAGVLVSRGYAVRPIGSPVVLGVGSGSILINMEGS